MINYTDETAMTFGIHKGEKLANVPADYLMFLYRESKLTEPLKKYIEENKDILIAEEKAIIAEKKLAYKQSLR